MSISQPEESPSPKTDLKTPEPGTTMSGVGSTKSTWPIAGDRIVKSRILVGAIVVILLLSGGVAVAVSQVRLFRTTAIILSPEILPWKTYKNQEWAIEIDYPHLWYAYEWRGEPRITTLPEGEERLDDNSLTYALITIFRSSDRPIASYLEKYAELKNHPKRSILLPYTKDIVIDEMIFDGRLGYKITGVLNKEGISLQESEIKYLIPALHGDSVFAVRVFSKGAKHRELARIADGIIASFRYIE